MLRQHASLLLFVYLFIIIYNQKAGAVGYKKRVRGRHEDKHTHTHNNKKTLKNNEKEKEKKRPPTHQKTPQKTNKPYSKKCICTQMLSFWI